MLSTTLKNTKELYKHKSTFELIRATTILSICKRKWIVSPFVSMLRATESSTAAAILRRTIWPHFSAGESIEDCQEVARKLKYSGVRLMIDHSVEERESEKDWALNLRRKKRLLKRCENDAVFVSNFMQSSTPHTHSKHYTNI